LAYETSAEGAKVKDLILDALRESVKRYPDIIPYLQGTAAWIIIEDDLQAWQNEAVKRINSDQSAICDYSERIIPDAIADVIKDMLAYADCEKCVETVFSDARAFMKKKKPKGWYQKFKPWTGAPMKPSTEKDWTITQEDIDRALAKWDELMPDYKGMLDADVKVDEDA
jgi:hypothetical protein